MSLPVITAVSVSAGATWVERLWLCHPGFQAHKALCRAGGWGRGAVMSDPPCLVAPLSPASFVNLGVADTSSNTTPVFVFIFVFGHIVRHVGS